MSRRVWLLLTLATVLGIVAATCWPILARPQLEPDDYRYLRLAEDVRAGRMPLTEAWVVENGWDHLWFPATDAVVRFFRPTVVTSVLVEAMLSDRVGGHLLTNVALHFVCALLVAWLALRLLGPGLPALLVAALFAAFAAHGEVLWYMSGRTATLAAAGFLATVLLHASGTRWRWAALPCFLFALASKELTVGAPLVGLLHDGWVARRGSLRGLLRRDWPLYAGYGAVAVGFLLLRSAVIGGVGDLPLREPYFVSPLSAAFPGHLGVQFWSYGENLLLAASTPPFLKPSELGIFTTPFGLLAVAAAAGSTVWFLRRDKRFWFVAALALVAWLPTSLVYVSERYLYLPSAAVAISAGLLLQVGWRHRLVRAGLIALVVVWCGHQARTLQLKHRFVAHAPRVAWAVSAQVQELAPRLPRAARLLFVNFPSDVVHAQFLEDQLRVTLDDPELSCRVLTLAPPVPGGAPAMRRLDAHTLELRAPAALMTADRVFPFAPMQPGTVIRRPQSGCAEVTVLDGDGSTLRAARFRFDEPIADATIISWQPPATARTELQPGVWILQGRMRIVRP